MKKYAVVVYYTFDPETCVYLFDTYEEACDYLQNEYIEEWNARVKKEGGYEVIVPPVEAQ